MTRRYRSALRDEQVKATRERILDGLLEAMKGGLAELSVPAVARAAKVSVPTIYRHFPTKQALFDAIAEHVGQRTGLGSGELPRSPEGLFEWIRHTYAKLDRMEPALAAVMTGALGRELRRKTMIPKRLRMVDEALAEALGKLPPTERTHLRNVAIVLGSSAALRTFQSYLGLSADEAAETTIWALRTLIERGASRTKRG